MNITWDFILGQHLGCDNIIFTLFLFSLFYLTYLPICDICFIPTKVIWVDYIHYLGLSIKRETFSCGKIVKLPFLHQYMYLVFFNVYFFLN